MLEEYRQLRVKLFGMLVSLVGECPAALKIACGIRRQDGFLLCNQLWGEFHPEQANRGLIWRHRDPDAMDIGKLGDRGGRPWEERRPQRQGRQRPQRKRTPTRRKRRRSARSAGARRTGHTVKECWYNSKGKEPTSRKEGCMPSRTTRPLNFLRGPPEHRRHGKAGGVRKLWRLQAFTPVHKKDKPVGAQTFHYKWVDKVKEELAKSRFTCADVKRAYTA